MLFCNAGMLGASNVFSYISSGPESIGATHCEDHIRNLYNQMKLKQIRHLYENDPLQIL